MKNLRFQLVIQFSVTNFSATNLDEYDALIELETALTAEKGIFVDGHDSGMGEFNIFIHTNEPKNTFERVSDLIETQRPGLLFTAGYRDFSEDDYIPLWPASLKSFSIA
jgi:hypothetical protein